MNINTNTYNIKKIDFTQSIHTAMNATIPRAHIIKECCILVLLNKRWEQYLSLNIHRTCFIESSIIHLEITLTKSNDNEVKYQELVNCILSHLRLAH